MDDARLSPQDQARNRRLFGGMIGWLLTEKRRPGMLGAAKAFTGKAMGESARLDRVEIGWELTTPKRSERLDTGGVLRLVGSDQFFPQAVELVPDLAELLFMEAVHQAEVSLVKLDLAATHTAELASEDSELDLAAWVLATAELDRVVRASITSVVLAVAAGEAQVNRWASEFGGWEASQDRLNVAQKCIILASRVGTTAGLDRPPFQQLHAAVKRRNSFVHSKPVPEPIPVVGARAPLPGTTISVEARATCLAVRNSFLELARSLSVEPPSYLAYCPDVVPSDDVTWRSATVMTGIRRDAAFRSSPGADA